MIQDTRTRTRRAIRRRERLVHRLSLGLTRGLAGFVTVVVLAASALVFAPAASAGTDDYPDQWKNVPIDSMFDTWLEYNRECTSFVAWRLHSKNGFEMPFHNDATGWADDARARGYTVDMNPTVGSVAWWAYGHLAWVESVNPGGTVTVEAYNWRTVTGAHDGAYHENTYSVSAPSGYIHFKDSGSGVHSGDFVSYRGDVYRIAGGAPIYVSNWATFGGIKPTIALSDSQWAGLRTYPADGTLVSAQPSQQVFTIVGGAPLYISDWATVGGAKPTVSIGDDDIRNADQADAASPWNHLRFHPSDGTFVSAQPSQRVYQVTGGAPSYISDWASVGGVQPVTNVGDDVIRNAGTPDHASQWSHLRQRLFGTDRFETSAAISAWRFSSGVGTVYIANGFNFPDALSGAALAGSQGTSVLLVTADAIPAAIGSEPDAAEAETDRGAWRRGRGLGIRVPTARGIHNRRRCADRRAGPVRNVCGDLEERLRAGTPGRLCGERVELPGCAFGSRGRGQPGRTGSAGAGRRDPCRDRDRAGAPEAGADRGARRGELGRGGRVRTAQGAHDGRRSRDPDRRRRPFRDIGGDLRGDVRSRFAGRVSGQRKQLPGRAFGSGGRGRRGCSDPAHACRQHPGGGPGRVGPAPPGEDRGARRRRLGERLDPAVTAPSTCRNGAEHLP
ncbi:cell wall-binding repeat-containing protein [Cryobacterium breve]|uniref:Cell wall-binding repeat-containing protein n=1 Tax=Cryobacterium breve TaxID=1259258 RepID=A0ABY7NC78_9MICO|nr:CHAP domain-containing protein [Cryobacterium breve]WBM79372.1 cell wall-binding repeat-containing protein [Cryobacterium breve]